MMRMIARLDIKGPNLVKGVHLEGLRVLGKPEDFARLYSHAGVDELCYVDVVASLYGRNSLTDIVARTSAAIAIPLTVGGGLRTLDDIATVLRAGADKVLVNTAAVRDPTFITAAARRFGSSTVVVAVEAIARLDGSYEALSENGRERTGRDARAWAIEAADRGAGEILVTAIAREGTGRGFDCDLVAQIASAVRIPVIAHGGAGTIAHVAEVIAHGHADAVALASILHYRAVHDLPGDREYAGEGNTDFLRHARIPDGIAPCTIAELKESLSARGCPAGRSVAAGARAAAMV